MTEEELGQKLREMYDTAKRNEAACQVHLFGIIYGREIRERRFAARNIIQTAGISLGYTAELSKGIKLSKYVRPIQGL